MKPSIPQGTRDFSPTEVRKRQYILQTLKSIFECYGFDPLETPAMENLITLTGKYGEEGDRLIFKILNNGLYEKKDADKEKLQQEWQQMLARPYTSVNITERALRYDLTIPFARYVVMHQHEIAFPFRRYQMQPVWRADRPQKGRYREFWQCDCDIIGTESLICEAELLNIYEIAFQKLQIPEILIKINNRKILLGIAETAGIPTQMMDMTVALDKLDKIGWEGVEKEMLQKNIPESAIAKIKSLTSLEGDNFSRLSSLEVAFQDASPTGLKGIQELNETLELYKKLRPDTAHETSSVQWDCCLARGLNYYTGFITEVVSQAVKIGSIGGGGRYDDLTGLFGLKNISGVGISFGIDRIYDVMEALQLFPASLTTNTKVLIINFGGEEADYAMEVLRTLRTNGVSAELYPEPVKFDRQMKYAHKRAIPFVILPGEDERIAGKLSLKNFATGEQQLLSREEVLAILTQ